MEKIKSKKFYVVTLDYNGGGQDIIAYSRKERTKIVNDYLTTCRLCNINDATITTYIVEIDDINVSEQSFFDGFVKNKYKAIETITINLL